MIRNGNNFDQGDSKSCGYLSGAHLSIQREQISENALLLNGGKGYKTAFFENDSDLEDYTRKLREALKVQTQKEKNISFEDIRAQYENWAKEFQSLYKKRSMRNILFNN